MPERWRSSDSSSQAGSPGSPGARAGARKAPGCAGGPGGTSRLSRKCRWRPRPPPAAARGSHEHCPVALARGSTPWPPNRTTRSGSGRRSSEITRSSAGRELGIVAERPTRSGARVALPGEIGGRDVGPEVDRFIAGQLDHVGGHPQPEGVLLAFDRGHQDPGRHHLVPEAGTVDARHRPVRERRREMLVGDRDLSLPPELADPPHRRSDHPLVEARHAQALAHSTYPSHPRGAAGVGDRECLLIGAGEAANRLVGLAPGLALDRLGRPGHGHRRGSVAIPDTSSTSSRCPRGSYRARPDRSGCPVPCA